MSSNTSVVVHRAFADQVESVDRAIIRELEEIASTLPEEERNRVKDFASRYEVESVRRVAWLRDQD